MSSTSTLQLLKILTQSQNLDRIFAVANNFDKAPDIGKILYRKYYKS